MDHLSLDTLARAIAENESALRSSFGDAGLPEAWDHDLAALPRESPTDLLVYYARVKHYYWVRYEERQKKQQRASQPTTADVQEAARALLTRESVPVVIAGAERAVTGRSYNALAQIAAHHLRILGLTGEVKHVEGLYAQTLRQHRGARGRKAVRKRLNNLQNLHGRLLTEVLLHRRALYVHAFTPTGAAATREEVETAAHAPFWRETTVEDDGRLVLALWESGPGRYARLVADQPAKEDDSGFVHDFGFHSLLAWIEGKRKIAPAALYDHDVGQLLASVRAAVPKTPELET